MITRKQYMKNSGELHHSYYAQFVTNETFDFVKNRIGLKKLLKSNDPHLNDIIKMSGTAGGTWVWDYSPVNITLMREAGEIASQSAHTCVGKAAARILIEQYKTANNE